MSLTGGLIPLGGSKKISTSPLESFDDDEFDALLGDMLDEPVKKSPGKSGKKKSSPSEKKKKKDTSKKDGDYFPSPQKRSTSKLDAIDNNNLSPMNSPFDKGRRSQSPFGESSGKLSTFDSSTSGDAFGSRKPAPANITATNFYDGNGDDGNLDDSILGNFVSNASNSNKRNISKTNINSQATAPGKLFGSGKASGSHKGVHLKPLDGNSAGNSLNSSSDSVSLNIPGIHGGDGQWDKSAKLQPSPPVTKTKSHSSTGGNIRMGNSFRNSNSNLNTVSTLGDSDLETSRDQGPTPVAATTTQEINTDDSSNIKKMDPVEEDADVNTITVAAPKPDDDELGFIPSFYEGGGAASTGRGRSRRNLGSTKGNSGSTNLGSSLDELDRALGLSNPASTTGVNPPRTRDPFSTASERLTKVNDNDTGFSDFPPQRDQIARYNTLDESMEDITEVKDVHPSRSGSSSEEDYNRPVRNPGEKREVVKDVKPSVPVIVEDPVIVVEPPAEKQKEEDVGTTAGFSYFLNKKKKGNSSNSGPAVTTAPSQEPVNAPLRGTDPTSVSSKEVPVPVGVLNKEPIVEENLVVETEEAIPAAKVDPSPQNTGGSEGSVSPAANAKYSSNQSAKTPRRKNNQLASSFDGSSTAVEPGNSTGIVLSMATVGSNFSSPVTRSNTISNSNAAEVVNASVTKLPSVTTPAWLPAPSSVSGGGNLNLNDSMNGAVGTVSVGSVNSSLEANSGPIVRQLQQKLEASQLQAEAVERQLRAEVESWKSKLHQHTSGPGGSDSHTAQLEHEVASLKQMVSQLQTELNHSKDENILQSVRNQDEVRYLKQKHSVAIEELENHQKVELQDVENRHAQVISSLKRIHMDEINSIKERSRDGDILTQLSTQMKSTSGSIKLMEEQLHLKYKNLEAAKEGQIEARERLLADMEQKARERADAAEAEGYRLKGLLSHMEQMVENLRSQSGEEKERLRMEHQRLLALQASLESDRNNLHSRNHDEYDQIKKKKEELETYSRKMLEEQADARRDTQEMRNKLEHDKLEFAAFARNATKSAELGFSRLKDEELRLQRVKEELSSEKNLLEQRKVSAMNDIQSANQLKQSIQIQYDDIKQEREQLTRLAQDLQIASDNLSQREIDMEALKKSLEDRERVLNNGITEMQNACRNLARKEEEVMIYAKKLEDQQRILEGVDSELLNKKVAIASAQRELNVMSMNNMWQNMHAKQQLKIDVNPPVPRKKEYVNCSATYPPQSVPKPTGRSPVSVSSPTNLSPAYTGASSHSNSHYGYNKPPDGQQIVIKDEIERARRVLDQSKNNHAQNSPYYQTVVQTQEFIHAETDFLNRIRKNSPISK